MNKKLFILCVLIALCGVLCCGFVTAVELDNGTSAEPLSVDEEVSVESINADDSAPEPLSVEEASVESINADDSAPEPLSVDSGVSSSTSTDTVRYKTVTYHKKVFSHYKKYTKKFRCTFDGKSVKAVKKYFGHRMKYGDDECCSYSAGRVIRAWYYNDKAYSWDIKKVKQISQKRYSAQAGGRIARYELVVKLYYKKPVYKTVPYTEKVRVY